MVQCLDGEYLMCVAGKDSSWRDRKSSLCLSWCFCFSGRSAISGFSISSSISPRQARVKGQTYTDQMGAEQWSPRGKGGCQMRWLRINAAWCKTSRYKARGCTLDEPKQWSPRGEADLCMHTKVFYTDCASGTRSQMILFCNAGVITKVMLGAPWYVRVHREWWRKSFYNSYCVFSQLLQCNPKRGDYDECISGVIQCRFCVCVFSKCNCSKTQ